MHQDNHSVYKRKDTEMNGYIKTTTAHPIDISLKEKDAREVKRNGTPPRIGDFSDDDYLKAMLDPAVQKLRDLRDSCGGIPLKMLLTTRTIPSCNKVAEFFNKTYDLSRTKKYSEMSTFEKARTLKCAPIAGSTKHDKK